MLKKMKQLITVMALGFTLTMPLAVVGVASAQPNIQEQLEQGTCLQTEGCENVPEAEPTIDNLIEDVVNIFSLIVGVVAVIMIIIGGFQYITSAGDSNKVSTAKNTILYAIIGLIIVALAQIIVRFVLGRVVSD